MRRRDATNLRQDAIYTLIALGFTVPIALSLRSAMREGREEHERQGAAWTAAADVLGLVDRSTRVEAFMDGPCGGVHVGVKEILLDYADWPVLVTRFVVAGGAGVQAGVERPQLSWPRDVSTGRPGRLGRRGNEADFRTFLTPQRRAVLLGLAGDWRVTERVVSFDFYGSLTAADEVIAKLRMVAQAGAALRDPSAKVA
jgi:hypothetical protein